MKNLRDYHRINNKLQLKSIYGNILPGDDIMTDTYIFFWIVGLIISILFILGIGWFVYKQEDITFGILKIIFSPFKNFHPIAMYIVYFILYLLPTIAVIYLMVKLT